jgi:tetratricopeptide (TPR) repeat protein
MQEYHVKGLEVAEGIELLQKLKVEGAEQELSTAVEHCAGHAFALTLLALLLRKRNLRLSAFFRDSTYTQVWTGNVARNLLDSIYSLQLDEMQRKLLLAFSVYREPVPLDAALTITDGTSDFSRAQVQYALDGLLAQHLLQASGDGRYQLHAIVSDYARHHFDTRNEQANQQAVRVAHARAVQYYQQRAALECPSQQQRRQVSDVQPLIEAVWQLCQAEQWREAYELMRQEAIFVDLERWGGYAILLDLYQLLPPPDKWRLEPSQAAHLYNHWGEAYRSLGRREQARERFECALHISQTEGERKEEGWALNNLGRVEAALENKERGLKYYEQALVIFKEEKDLAGESTALTNLGWVYYDLDMLQRAQECYEQALSIRREERDRLGEAASLNSLGRVYANLGQPERARTYHEQALHICREIGYRSGEGWTLNNLGRVYSALGDKQQALDYLQRALTIRREIGSRSGEASTLTNLGRVYLDLGEKEQAKECLELALPIRREVGDRSGEAKTLINLGKVYTNLGKKESVLLYYRQALSICRELGQNKKEASVLNKIGLLSVEQRRYDLALACFLLSRDLLTTLQFSNVDEKNHDNVALSYIDDLHEKIGDEQFSLLLAKVEPQAHQIVEQVFQERT